MVDEEPNRSSPKQSENGENRKCLFSPGFRSVVAKAGWDEETLLMASNDTPDRNSKPKRRSDPMFKSPSAISRRKRRDQRNSPVSKLLTALEETLEEKKEQKINGEKLDKSNELSSGNALIPCIDRLREELSCAICLEICFEPSTTLCGHSFCKKCLKSAADKCGHRCPKCRQLISNGRSCIINTVLWNTIQLLFPEEIETKKMVIQEINSNHNLNNHNKRNQSFRPASVVLLNNREAGDNGVSRRRRWLEEAAPPRGQDGDAALALRLQREEFMGRFVAEAAGNRMSMISRICNLRRL